MRRAGISRAGWTLVELILVVLILSILALFAFSRFYNISGEAVAQQEKAIIGAVQQGIYLQQADEMLQE